MNISIGFSYCQNSDGKCDLPKYHDIELRAPNGLEEIGGKLVLAVKDTCKRVLSGAPSPQDWEKLGEKIKDAWARATLYCGNAECELSGLMDELDDLLANGGTKAGGKNGMR